ncbi:uncharacterized protein [Solanum lycopersicum]|uniref:Uncharacterized protein LOC107008344 n=1 Tax=Solanum pennellii TaxID=28526 RepID=A0ABM1FWY4_SOLPN|nr:uncharacterized protein LOC101259881 [Solanum lycopersicum]XP_015062823.1 uncharacterized protein LOC107008344 [Solanum pennellii]
MGLVTSLAAKGLSTTQVINKATGKFNELFLGENKRNLDNLDDFHLAILDMFVTVNGALPGKHWVVPPFEKIKECFEEREKAVDEERKKTVVVEFLKKYIQPNKADNTLLFIGLATPPAAMAVKKTGESVPQLKLLKRIPDVVFVPAATLLTLVSVKITRSLLLQRAASEDHLVAKKNIGTSDSG